VIENDQLYADACFPNERWTVCGVKLKPFSLGHALVLQSIGSPFLGFEPIGLDDLMFALWVCSRDVTPGENPLRDKLPLSWRIHARFLKRIAEKDRQRIWNSAMAMQSYVFESLWFKPPIATRNNNLCRDSTCPLLVPMKRSLMTQWGRTEQEVYRMPLRQAKFEHCAWLEHEGALRFVTQADIEMVDLMKRTENVEWNKRVREENAKKMAEKGLKKAA
jgi:hypothetical protein